MTAQPHAADGHLPAARNRLDHAISALIDPKPHLIHRDNTDPEITWLDPLYTQLADAVAGQNIQPKSGGPARAPIWADAHDLLTLIDTKAAEWQPDWHQLADPNHDTTPPTITRLHALRARKWRPQDVSHINTITTELHALTERAQTLLDPPAVAYLRAPGKSREPAACTACGEQRVWRPDPTDPNRRVMQPALKITIHGCICQHCGASWEPGQLRILAAALGYPLPEGVLE